MHMWDDTNLVSCNDSVAVSLHPSSHHKVWLGLPLQLWLVAAFAIQLSNGVLMPRPQRFIADYTTYPVMSIGNTFTDSVCMCSVAFCFLDYLKLRLGESA